MLRLLEADYPEPFHIPAAPDRMRLYSLAYAIRPQLVDLPPGHSLHRVRRLVTGTWPAPNALPSSLTP
ncbi:hypothetical protein [Actinoalloteichus caeruleus]|uniref:hypothetical protein n=1 Tax=Actinoalloteichus cyanogriseus TaxID=2893586 RepID=UPI003AB09B76